MCSANSPRRSPSCVPGLPKEDLYWRLDFVAGALTYAMADFGLIKRPAGVTEREAALRKGRPTSWCGSPPPALRAG